VKMVDEDIKSFMSGSVSLGRFSGLEFQQDLGLRWHPLDEENLKYGISLYYESYDEPRTKNKTLLDYRKKVLAKKGYLFHVSGDKKDYIGFRKFKWDNFSDIFLDIADYFEEVEDDV
jgi:hypothetical protein